MSDHLIVRARRMGWDVYRLPDGSTARQTIARDVRTWGEVQQVLHETSAAMGGYAWPEQRTPRTDIFSLRTEPESTTWQHRD